MFDLTKKILCLVILLIFSNMGAALADTSIGSVKKLNGTATVTRANAAAKVNLGDPVYMGDILKTGPAGSMGVTFKDNTMISIGPNTVYTIDEYVYQPKDQKISFVSRVSKGTLNFVSGNITKIAPNSVKVNSSVGTIGIRGTHFLFSVEGEEK
jgi:hypothetical protein